jgi:hypothetical protein
MPGYPGYYPGIFGGFPPHEIAAIVRSKGLEPLGRPKREGGAYTLRATDESGRVVQVTVDAWRGRIVRVAPTNRAADAIPPPPSPIPSAPDRAPPDGNGVHPRITAAPPYPDDDFEPLERGPATAPAPAAPRVSARVLPPPLPRPRPNVETTSVPATSASADSTPTFTDLEE